jgi:peptide/nickel transport system substrate-binding protein
MRRRHLYHRLLTLAFAFILIAPSLAAAQDASPAATPESGASPEASPVGSGQHFVSKTRDEVRAETEAEFALEPAQNTEGTLVDGVTGDLQSLNPFLAEEQTSLAVTGLIFDTLVGGDPKTGQPVPGGLSDYYEIDADGVTYTFHLSKAAKWQDGVDFTAADVDYSFNVINDPATTSTYTGTFQQVVKSWKVIDDDTIQVVSNGVQVAFLYNFFSVPIVAKHIWENVAHADFATDPGSTGSDASRVVGTGPFKFKEWKQGEQIVLDRNDDYYAKKPDIKEYILRIFPDTESQFNAFLKGEIDTSGIEPAKLPALASHSEIATAVYDDRGFTYYEFNLNPDHGTKFVDARVRQAFMYALDRDSIVNDILDGYGEVSKGPQPTISYAYQPDKITTNYTYDPDKAKALLANAGWTDTNGDGTVDKDGVEMKFDFLYPAGSAETDSVMAYVQEALKAVGIDATPKPLEFSALIEATTTNPDWDIALYGFGWDASFIQETMFACNQYQVGFNDMKYCNPELDKLFTQMDSELDQAKRIPLMIQAANIVNDEQPVGILFYAKVIAAWNKRVHNQFPGPWGGPGILYTWVDAS